VCLTLRLPVELFLLLLHFLILYLVILIIGTLSNKITSLTALEAQTLSSLFVLVGVVFASFQCGLEALYYKRHFLLIKSSRLHLCKLVWKRLRAGHCFECNGLQVVERKRYVGDVVDVHCLFYRHAPAYKLTKDFLRQHFGIPRVSRIRLTRWGSITVNDLNMRRRTY
jgi:hypothetical protein